jgi:hypothetical protein
MPTESCAFKLEVKPVSFWVAFRPSCALLDIPVKPFLDVVRPNWGINSWRVDKDVVAILQQGPHEIVNDVVDGDSRRKTK